MKNAAGTREAEVAQRQADRPHGLGYLPFLDGLRAISILAVVGFHVGVPGFSGGFVGVDVFFVISGFLICNQIKSGLEAGRFSLAAFYGRRGIRILPAFLTMLLAVYVAAPFILPSPTVYRDFALAAVTAPLMVSNILFYRRQGYFDIAADEKPLLHTWTLSVEEQFYFVVPVLLMLTYRFGGKRFGRAALALAIAIGAASLIGAILKTTATDKNPAFYLLHFRAWEFVAGALITGPAIDAIRRAPRAVIETMAMMGLVAIVAAITLLDSRMPYPSWRAIVPVAGAATMILAGAARQDVVAVRLLSSRGLVAIGLVSYGWYLWHWPILSFLRVLRLGQTALVPDLLGGAGLGLALAWLSYRYVELPIRQHFRPSSGQTKLANRIAVVAVSSCFIAAAIGGSSAWLGYTVTGQRIAMRYGTQGHGVLTSDCQISTGTALPDHCLLGRYGVLIGDSSAGAMAGSFARYFDASHVRLDVLARGGCNILMYAPEERRQHPVQGCSNLNGPLERILAAGTPPEFVIFQSAWADRGQLTAVHVAALFAQFDPTRTKILMIGPVPIFPAMSLDCVVLNDKFGRNRDDCIMPRAETDRHQGPVIAVLKAAVATFPNARFVEPSALFCDASMCRPFKGDKVFYRDQVHVVPQGADTIIEGFTDDFRRLTAGR